MVREPTAEEWNAIRPRTFIPWRPGLLGLFIGGRLVAGGAVEEDGTGWIVLDREAARWPTAVTRAIQRYGAEARRVHVQDNLVRGAELVEYLGFRLAGVVDDFGLRWLCYER